MTTDSYRAAVDAAETARKAAEEEARRRQAEEANRRMQEAAAAAQIEETNRRIAENKRREEEARRQQEAAAKEAAQREADRIRTIAEQEANRRAAAAQAQTQVVQRTTPATDVKPIEQTKVPQLVSSSIVTIKVETNNQPQVKQQDQQQPTVQQQTQQTGRMIVRGDDSDISEEKKRYIDKLREEFHLQDFDKKDLYITLGHLSESEIRQEMGRISGQWIQRQQKTIEERKQAQEAAEDVTALDTTTNKDTNIIAVGRSTNPDKFLVYYIDEKGYTRSKTMTRQQIIDANGEVPVSGSGWWGNPGTRGDKLVSTQGVTESDIIKAYKDLGLDPPDFTKAPRDKIDLTGDGMLDGFKDEKGNTYIAHPSAFGGIQAAVDNMRNILDPAAKEAYIKAFKAYWGIAPDKVVTTLPGEVEKAAASLGFKSVDDKQLKETIERYKKNPDSIEFKLKEDGGSLTVEQKAYLSKLAKIKYNPEEDFRGATVQIGIDVTRPGEEPVRISKSEYDQLKAEHPELADLLKKKGVAAYKAAVKNYDERIEADITIAKQSQEEFETDLKESDPDGWKAYEKAGKGEAGYKAYEKLTKERQERFEEGQRFSDQRGWEAYVKGGKGEAGWKAYNEYFNRENIVIDGSYMPRKEYEALDRKYQNIALTSGFQAMRDAVTVDINLQNASLGALAWTKNEDGTYDTDKLAYVLRNNPVGRTIIERAGFSKETMADLEEINWQPWVQRTPHEKLYQAIKDKFGIDAREYATNPTQKQIDYLNDVVYKDPEIKEMLKQANTGPGSKQAAPVSLEEFERRFVAARMGKDVSWTSSSQKALQDEGALKVLADAEYNRLYGFGATVSSLGVQGLSIAAFSPARVLYPEVEIKDITPMEWASGAFQVALLAAPGIANVLGKGVGALGGKAAGQIATRFAPTALGLGASCVFTSDTIMNLKNMTPEQIGLSATMDTLIIVASLLSLKGGIKGVTAKQIDAVNAKAGKAVTDKIKANISPEAKAYNLSYDTTKAVINAIEEAKKVSGQKGAGITFNKNTEGLLIKALKDAKFKAGDAKIAAQKIINSLKEEIYKTRYGTLAGSGEKSAGIVFDKNTEGALIKVFNEAKLEGGKAKVTVNKFIDNIKQEIYNTKHGTLAGGGEKSAGFTLDKNTEGAVIKALNKAGYNTKTTARAFVNSLKEELYKTRYGTLAGNGEKSAGIVFDKNTEGALIKAFNKAKAKAGNARISSVKFLNNIKREIYKIKYSTLSGSGEKGTGLILDKDIEGSIRQAYKTMAFKAGSAKINAREFINNIKEEIYKTKHGTLAGGGEKSAGFTLDKNTEGAVIKALNKAGYKVKGGKLVARAFQKGIKDASTNMRKLTPSEMDSIFNRLTDAIKSKDVNAVKKVGADLEKIGKDMPDDQGGQVIANKGKFIQDRAAEIVKIAEKRLKVSQVKDITGRLGNNMDFVESPGQRTVAEYERLNKQIDTLEKKLQSMKKENVNKGTTAQEYIDSLKSQLSDKEGRLAAFRRGETFQEVKNIFEKKGRLKEFQQYQNKLKQIEELQAQLKNYRYTDEPFMIAKADTLRRQIDFLKMEIQSWETRYLTSDAASSELQAAVDDIKASRKQEFENTIATGEESLKKLKAQRAKMADNLSDTYGIKITGKEKPPAAGKNRPRQPEDRPVKPLEKGGGVKTLEKKAEVKKLPDLKEKIKEVDPDIEKLRKAKEKQKETTKTEDKPAEKTPDTKKGAKTTTKTSSPGTDRPVKAPQPGGPGLGRWAVVWESGEIKVKWIEDETLQEGFIRHAGAQESDTEAAQRLKDLLKAKTIKQALEIIKREFPGKSNYPIPYINPSELKQPQPKDNPQPTKSPSPEKSPSPVPRELPAPVPTPVPVPTPEPVPGPRTEPAPEPDKDKIPPPDEPVKELGKKIKGDTGSNEKKEWTKKEFNSALKWKDGFVIHAIKSPFRPILDVKSFNVNNLPDGFDISGAIEEYKGPGSQEKSAKIKGNFPAKLSVDVGNQDAIFTRRGKKIKLRHVRDMRGTVSQTTIKRNHTISKKKGRLYHTDYGGSNVISRRPLKG